MRHLIAVALLLVSAQALAQPAPKLALKEDGMTCYSWGAWSSTNFWSRCTAYYGLVAVAQPVVTERVIERIVTVPAPAPAPVKAPEPKKIIKG
jgi:hypothetical protein